ncbi:MAG: DUF167 family protein [Rhodospirillaceae bacterium]|nr:DUF167 family protein [Rhodospirillaceae bacterium]
MNPLSRPFFRQDADGLNLTLKVQPKSSRDAIEGVVETPDGLALKVAVTAPPDKGKANAAVIALVAKAFGVPKTKVTVTLGETDRRKVLHIAGAPGALVAIAQQWEFS